MRLFENPPGLRGSSLTPELAGLPGLTDSANRANRVSPVELPGLSPVVGERMLDLYARARDPADALELRDLWLGRVECECGGESRRPELATRWRASRPRRTVSEEEVLSSAATVRFVKELFNWFFSQDVYGDLRDQVRVILSSGSVDEGTWGLPPTLKQCIAYAADRDWYGYSDSRGRVPAREAVARYENATTDGAPYDAANVALTLGGTFAISSVADFLLSGARPGAPALCGIPNYPPLVAAIVRRCETRLVPLPCSAGTTSVEALIAALTPDTPLVMVQTVANPTGAAISEPDLERLIRAAAPATMILLDECHDWLGPARPRSRLRAAANVVRVSSLSKTWSAPGIKAGWILADASFIESYYEYASTSYGGPPSFFYTFIEVLARMERWILSGLDEPGPAELSEFEPGYGLEPASLAVAYRSYRTDRIARERDLIAMRNAAVAGLADAGARVIGPQCSINVAAEIPGWDDSYVCFRDLLRLSGVSVFPGVLLFCPAGAIVRITTARRWADLSLAIARLRLVLESVQVRRG